ncbi:uncharacterized protein LOC130668484 [Microplitis mediator]|uniref:uncharacterized protein LOC130668484 n=1 Tax=Microplitis mediator TaxID=375433 RepID=UPI00255534CF|nr:uncharacterized protein LOC130668484 [Microplitis mediator]
MRLYIIISCLILIVNSYPLRDEYNSEASDHYLTLVKENNDAALRSKRTVGVLRQFFPEITENQRSQQLQDLDIAESENKEVRVAFEDTDQSINEASADLSSLDNIEIGDDENRNKRFSGGNGESGGSGGGSGNFIFDIIRLIAGSGSPPSDDSSPHGKHDPEEAVPGPATRFLVIANRGLSNLIQDLILRIAATSERFVNFKARLITSII